jgi:peroxiredoxin
VPNTLQYIKKEKAWQKKYDAAAPRVGDIAPDFELADVIGEHQVRLSDFRGQKPVALVFGSFT